MFRGGDNQLITQLVLELDESNPICPRRARGDRHLVGEDLNERICDGLVGAGVTNMHLQGHCWREKRDINPGRRSRGDMLRTSRVSFFYK